MDIDKRGFKKCLIMLSFLRDDNGLSSFKQIEKLYYAAGLGDNQKLRSRIASDKVNQFTINQSVIADVISLLAEEILENELLEKEYIKVMNLKYPSVAKKYYNLTSEEDFKKIVKVYENTVGNGFVYALYLNIDNLYNFNPGFTNDLKDYVVDTLFYDGKPIVDLKLNTGEDIIESGLFEKYKKRRISEICKYFGIDTVNEDTLYLFINLEMSLPCDEANNEITKSGVGFMIHAITKDIFHKLKLPPNWLLQFYGSWEDEEDPVCLVRVKDVVDSYYKGLLLSHYIPDMEENASNINKVSVMKYYTSESPLMDYFGICMCYQLTRLTMFISRFYYRELKNFSFSNYTNLERKDEKNVVLEDLKQQLTTTKKALEKANMEQQGLLEKKIKDESKIIAPYTKEIEELKKLLANKDKEIEKLKELNHDKDKLIEFLSEDNIEEVDDIVDFNLLSKQKVLLVGGRLEVINRLIPYFSISKTVSKATSSIDVSNIDNIIIFHDFLNHKLYYKVINLARDFGINVIYCKGSNLDYILKEIQHGLCRK